MSAREGPRRLYFFRIAVAALIAIAALAALSFVSVADLSRLALDTAKNNLLSDSMLIAQSLDGTLRLSDVVLEDTVSRIGSKVPLSEALVHAALGLPEAENIYCTDRQFTVLATAYARNTALLRIPADKAGRAAVGLDGSVFLIETPAEGGRTLASVRKTGNGSLLFAIFNSSIFDKKLSLLMDPSIRKVDIVDADGGILELRSVENGVGGGTDDMMEASFALSSFPLVIRVRANKQAILGTSLRRIQTFMPLALGCAAAALVLFGYGMILNRRAMRADGLEHELAAKDMLFHEVNHRVKNNLAVAGSIIGLGEGMVIDAPEDKKAETSIEVLRDTRHRLLSMSMLHEQLYKHASLAVVDLGAYLGDLSKLLATSYALSGIRIVADVSTGLRLNLSSSVPVALIVNELVTNAIKYAFPNHGGEIRIHACATATDGIEIEVSDDGVGPSENANTGFGSSLMEGLATQVDAKLTRLNKEDGGTAWLLSIPSATKEFFSKIVPTKVDFVNKHDRGKRKS